MKISSLFEICPGMLRYLNNTFFKKGDYAAECSMSIRSHLLLEFKGNALTILAKVEQVLLAFSHRLEAQVWGAGML